MRPYQIVSVLARRGLLQPTLPHRSLGQVRALTTWGFGLSGEARGAAARRPSGIAIVDESGRLTYAELIAQAERVTRVLLARGVRPGDRVAVLARNSRDLVIAMLAIDQLGGDVVLLNTGFAAEQLAAAAQAYGIGLVVHDEEFGPLLAETAVAALDLADLMALGDGPAGRGRAVRPPARRGHVIVLTSGTTGTPKGAPRRNPGGVDSFVAIIERIPLHATDRVLISAPIFHTWGFAALQLCFGLQATIVLRRRFEPATAYADLVEHDCQVMFAVPVMIQRLHEWRSANPGPQPPALRVVATSGSRLPATLPVPFMDDFGDVLYSLYGSTEASWVTIAVPEQLRAHPDTAGTPPLATRVALLDADLAEVPDGDVGQFYVANSMVFEGYLGGADSHRHDGLIATGDLGRHVDGLYYVDGRVDQMIVSGGENVYPAAVEDALCALEGVAEAAVLGVSDPEFGQRLIAFVVAAPGADVDGEAVRAALRGHISRFALPREVRVVDALPRNETGKVSLVALSALLAPKEAQGGVTGPH